MRSSMTAACVTRISCSRTAISGRSWNTDAVPAVLLFFSPGTALRSRASILSNVTIEQAAARARREDLQIAYRVMDAEQLTVPDNTFDLVCGVAILHHLDLDKPSVSLRAL